MLIELRENVLKFQHFQASKALSGVFVAKSDAYWSVLK